MSFTTPEKIRGLPRKLDVMARAKVKAEPTFRLYLLHACRLSRVNAGAPGVDGMGANSQRFVAVNLN